MKFLIILLIGFLCVYGNETQNIQTIDNPSNLNLQDKFFNNPTSKGNSNIDSNNQSTSSMLKQVFPNSYIENIITGFIDGLEETLLKIDIRRIAIDFSNTTINVSDEYRDLGINQFSGDNTTLANFVADLALEHNFENSRLSNTLFAEYGMVIVNPKYKSITKNETADNLIFNTGYTRKAFLFENGFLGPFIDGEYQTEFTRKEDGSRNQYLRYKAGLRFLDGKYIDEFYLSGVGEIDLSYSPVSIKGALETGIRAKTPINDDLKLIYQGFVRQYVGYSRFRDSDLLYNVNLSVRLDVSINSGIAFSPFVSARFAQIRKAKRSGSNIMTGISLLFSSSINAISSIQGAQDAMLSEYFKSIQ